MLRTSTSKCLRGKINLIPLLSSQSAQENGFQNKILVVTKPGMILSLYFKGVWHGRRNDPQQSFVWAWIRAWYCVEMRGMCGVGFVLFVQDQRFLFKVVISRPVIGFQQNVFQLFGFLGNPFLFLVLVYWQDMWSLLIILDTCPCTFLLLSVIDFIPFSDSGS